MKPTRGLRCWRRSSSRRSSPRLIGAHASADLPRARPCRGGGGSGVGRSPIQAALAGASSLGGPEQPEIAIVDRRAELETLVVMRSDLRRVQRLVKELTSDQKLVLASQLVDVPCRDFCRQFGWSAEKY